jgi:hypothetical protein
MYRNTQLQNVVEQNFEMFIKYFLIFLHFSLYWSKPKGNFQLENSLLSCIIKKQEILSLHGYTLLIQK